MVDHASDESAFTPPADAADSSPNAEKRAEERHVADDCPFGDICLVKDVICVCYPELNLGRWQNT